MNTKTAASKTILLIDDDKILSKEMADLLEGEGYAVQVAYDGLQGEKMLQKSRYDIVLLDYKLPGIDGVEMLKRVKKFCAKSRIIVISGRPFIEKLMKTEGLSKAIKDFVQKPFNVGLLLKKLKAV
jgi:DNA-binding response OmpR family regulator